MKPWYSSLTIRGAIIALLATSLRYFGIEAASEDIVTLIDALGSIAAMAGSIMAVIGRLRASQQIGKV